MRIIIILWFICLYYTVRGAGRGADRSSSTVYFLFLFYQKRKKERKKERKKRRSYSTTRLFKYIYIKKALDISSKGTVESDGQRGWSVNVYISDGEKEAFCIIIFNFR